MQQQPVSANVSNGQKPEVTFVPKHNWFGWQAFDSTQSWNFSDREIPSQATSTVGHKGIKHIVSTATACAWKDRSNRSSYTFQPFGQPRFKNCLRHDIAVILSDCQVNE